jgi:hypothetical protein
MQGPAIPAAGLLRRDARAGHAVQKRPPVAGAPQAETGGGRPITRGDRSALPSAGFLVQQMVAAGRTKPAAMARGVAAYGAASNQRITYFGPMRPLDLTA